MSQASYVRVSAAAKLLGCSQNQVRQLVSDGHLGAWRSAGGHRMIEMKSIRVFLGDDSGSSERIVIGYARVSTTGSRQESSLQTQISELSMARKNMGIQKENFLLLSEHGSGINWDRPKFNEILEKVFAKEVERILVTHVERLSRSGIKALTSLFERFDCEIVAIHQKTEQTPESELLAEITAALFAHGAREYGRRSSEKFAYRLRDEHLDLLDRWQDEEIDGRAIARKAEEMGMRDEKSGKKISYNWIIRRMRKRAKKKMLLAKSECSFFGSTLHKFFLAYLLKDSTGNATVGSHLLKNKFELWANEKGLEFDSSKTFYWSEMLEKYGIETFRDAKKKVTYIKGWKFKTSRQ